MEYPSNERLSFSCKSETNPRELSFFRDVVMGWRVNDPTMGCSGTVIDKPLAHTCSNPDFLYLVQRIYTWQKPR